MFVRRTTLLLLIAFVGLIIYMISKHARQNTVPAWQREGRFDTANAADYVISTGKKSNGGSKSGRGQGQLTTDNDTHVQAHSRGEVITDQQLVDDVGYVVNTPNCRILDVNAYDVSVRHLIVEQSALRCNATPPLTFVHGANIIVNKTALHVFYADNFDFCEYQAIARPNEPSDNRFVYLPKRYVFVDRITVEHEFVRVVCFGKVSTMIYQNFYAFILKNFTREKKLDGLYRKSKPREKYNYILLGIDSVSRPNFMRHLPKTRQYIKDQLGAVEMKGFNKVADNTYVNLAPLFAGKFVEDLPWDESHSFQPFDSFDFLWKHVATMGYRTLFAEDAPNIAIFNFAKEGFHTPPAHHYLRPFSLAIEGHMSLWNANHHCFGQRPETQIVLDYVRDFARVYKHEPYFAQAFLTRLSHESLNSIGMGDELYLNFFKALKEEKLLNRTVVIFYSDHGIRFGDIRQTYVGKLEERLPFLYMIMPEGYKSRNPSAFAHLVTNSARLTTPFDIYDTVMNLVHTQPTRVHKRYSAKGYSLLGAHPSNRSCADAGVDMHWCACYSAHLLDSQLSTVQAAGQSVVDHINHLLTAFRHTCATLTLKRIVNTFVLKHTNSDKHQVADIRSIQVQTALSSDLVMTNILLVTIETHPSEAVFEATLSVDLSVANKPRLTIVGDISRINEYGSQADCMRVHNLRKFCFCKRS